MSLKWQLSDNCTYEMSLSHPYTEQVDLTLFRDGMPGELVTISGSDPRVGDWTHKAFVPHPLDTASPPLGGETYRAVAEARAQLATLDTTAARLPNPQLLRHPTLRQEAQSTSALEGTFEPLREVLTADEDAPASEALREILNFVRVAQDSFESVADGRRLTVGGLASLQGRLLAGTSAEREGSGAVRTGPVVIGRRGTATHLVYSSRFVPPPAGPGLVADFSELLDWMNAGPHPEIDPVVAAGMAHYQFETLHPFHDGNGRIGRLLIVNHLLMLGVLSEPTLLVSPWFEARRAEYYDGLLAVSTTGDWDGWINLFARGLAESARATCRQLVALENVREQMREQVRASNLRAQSALDLVDYAVSRAAFTVNQAKDALGLGYGRVRDLVGTFEEFGLLSPLGERYNRSYYSPEVLDILLGAT